MYEPVEIFSTNPCPHCHAAKNLLQTLGIPYQEHVLDTSPASRKLVMEKTGGMSFPQILIDKEPIGGFQELQSMYHSGGLDSLIARSVRN